MLQKRTYAMSWQRLCMWRCVYTEDNVSKQEETAGINTHAKTMGMFTMFTTLYCKPTSATPANDKIFLFFSLLILTRLF